MLGEEPTKGFHRVGVLEIEADVFPALQRNFLPGDGGGEIARGAERAHDEMQAVVAVVPLQLETHFAVVIENAHAVEQRGKELAGGGVVAAGHGKLLVVNFAVDDQKVFGLHASRRRSSSRLISEIASK